MSALLAGSTTTIIIMATAFVLAAVLIGRGLFKRTIFPKVNLKEFVISVVAGSFVIWLVLNIGPLGILAGIGLVAFLLVPKLLKIKPLHF